MSAIGCIADDYTGATDVAAALRRAGLRVVLLFGTPPFEVEPPECDALVVALKSRTLPADRAVAESLEVHRWLGGHGVQQVYFKYCSTFDSTDAGNIGPVTDALLDADGDRLTVICPSSPEHERTVFQGHLFVGQTLLSESSMRHHPLTPMTDSNLVRLMSRQTSHPVALVPLKLVRAGADAVRDQLKALESDGVRHVVVDATQASDLHIIAAAASGLRLLTGGAGLAAAAGVVARDSLDVSVESASPALPEGPGIILAGSCSAATLAQVAVATATYPSYRLDPAATPDPAMMLADASKWLDANWSAGPVVIYSSAGPEGREAGIAAMGPDTADHLERTLGELARQAVSLGARRVVVAGGETSGSVVANLGVRTVVVEREADTGVPWCVTTAPPEVALLLKSGNFGSEDLLVRAMKER